MLRRIYKSPKECDPDMLLDYLVTLATSSCFYDEFDDKTRVWIREAIDLIEEKFTGLSSIPQTRAADVNKGGGQMEETFNLTYF